MIVAFSVHSCCSHNRQFGGRAEAELRAELGLEVLPDHGKGCRTVQVHVCLALLLKRLKVLAGLLDVLQDLLLRRLQQSTESGAALCPLSVCP